MCVWGGGGGGTAVAMRVCVNPMFNGPDKQQSPCEGGREVGRGLKFEKKS